MELPTIPCSFESFPRYLKDAQTQQDVLQKLEPFTKYEARLRRMYAQEATNTITQQNHLVPIYQNDTVDLKIRARDPFKDSKENNEKYLLPIAADKRRSNGSPAITGTSRDFQKNFNIFSESALTDLNWDNVVAAGSSVVTALLPTDHLDNQSKRALRTYYHEQLAPASDVDLFIYGLNEEQAIEKIKEIEANIRDAILAETTVVRTKNAVTIVSEYPTRHIQIVLRLYKSVSEILTGFDVDCACVAYDGKQVWAAPRALAAFATQTNSIDLTRRSPSYENRLSKYSHRGFEVYWPLLDRSRVDPTIYERAFNRVLGLARLLVLEKLPHPQDRDEYLTKRRAERGRPELPWNARFRTQLPGNIKDVQPDDVAEWVDEDDISSYHSFSIPWGPRYTPKKIERLLFQQDLLKNAEWNKPKDREASLHRHPAFFGRVEDVLHDCCGYCPKPVTDADLAAWEEESKVFVSGDLTFLQDDPGRQEIGSFHPLTDDDWTEMAYIGSTESLCQAIVDKDLEGVVDWFQGDEADVNRRDHTGRTPLQLAVMCSSPEIVQCLIDRGARIVARLYNGLTALHLAAWRGSPEMVTALLDKSAENELEEDKKEETRKQARREAAGVSKDEEDVEMTQVDEEAAEASDDEEDLMDEDSDAGSEDRMTGSFVKVDAASEVDLEAEKGDDPDVYDVDVVAWDSPCSALHLAIIGGHQEVIALLVDTYGADAMLPVKLMTNSIPREPRGAILTLLLPLDLPLRRATSTITMLLKKGASPVQALADQTTALHLVVDQAKVEILKTFGDASPEATSKAINHLAVKSGWNGSVKYPLLSAIRSGSAAMVREVLSMGAKSFIDLEQYVCAYNATNESRNEDPEQIEKKYRTDVTQPVIEAARSEEMIDIVLQLLKLGADVNTVTEKSWKLVQEPRYRYGSEEKTLLDLIRDHRQELEQFASGADEKIEPLKHVEPLQSDDYYLDRLKPGTYQHWSASKDLETARYIQEERAKKYQREFDAQKQAQPSAGRQERMHAAANVARKYKTVENRLIEEGAKSFYDLFSHLKEKEDDNRRGHHDRDMTDLDAEAYKTRFQFRGTNITPSQHGQYLKLFEAVFAGDIEKVKEMCMSSSEGRPLEAAVIDQNDFSLFAIAVFRGHLDVASTILDIAAAQYKHPKDTSQMHYSAHPYDSEDDEGSDVDSSVASDDERPRFYKRLVNDDFTIDDIDALSKDVKSKTKPLDLLNNTGRGFEVWRALPLSREQAMRKCRAAGGFEFHSYYHFGRRNSAPWSLFQQSFSQAGIRAHRSIFTYAVITNNADLMKFLFEVEAKYSTEDEDDLLKSLDSRKEELKHAMNLSYQQIVDTILRFRGTLLPLHHLAERSGVVVEEAPKYYQGLSVYGQKRKDWAKQDRYADAVDKGETGSPLLDAIMDGNIDIIDYFMSETPTRRYEEFSSRFKQDQRVRALAEGKGGVQAALKMWMSTRTNLALHITVMAWPAGASKTLRYLLEKVPPEYLEGRSAAGDTPLHLALKLGNLPAMELLLAAGANQRTRDKKGRNLLHTIWEVARSNEINLFKKKVSMLDKKIIPSLLLERCSGTGPGLLTPLSLYLLNRPDSNDKDLGLIEEMLRISGGKDLTVMDGAGDYPLHVQVRDNHRVTAQYLARQRPDLLFRENATGITPIEVAETRYLQSVCDHEPHLKGSVQSNGILNQRDEDFEKKEAGWAPASMQQSISENDDDDDNLPLSDQGYSNLVRIARAHPQPRSLVSVLDANEVARRLAGQQQRKNAEERARQARGLKSRRWRYAHTQQDMYDDDEADNGKTAEQDEVTRWYSVASERMMKVPVHLQDGEDLEAQMQKWRDFAEGKLETLSCCDKADSQDAKTKEGHQKMWKEISDPRV